jgi:hypothetical protein
MAAGDAFSQIRALAAAAIVYLCARRPFTSNEQSLQAVRAWWFSHMTRFLGAYIATVTAFSVVNFRFLSYVWRWLWPTVIGVIGIVFWRRYYAGKFEKQRSVTQQTD